MRRVGMSLQAGSRSCGPTSGQSQCTREDHSSTLIQVMQYKSSLAIEVIIVGSLRICFIPCAIMSPVLSIISLSHVYTLCVYPRCSSL
jgi:hypothetical protein